MSKVVDEKVVILNFDNKKFEKNIKQTTKSVNEFKKTMDFSEVSDSINEAYDAADPSKLSKSFDMVGRKLTKMEMVTYTIISRITNRLMDMGEKFVKSLSIDNISGAWSSYSEEIKSVATLVGQGFKENTVVKQLELLSRYTDATSYNFTDMTNNISKFTAAGIDLEKSTQAMMGIANWAAASGQNAQKASQAMYQLSQAIGAGVVKLQDWKSIQNVSMDTQEFREQVLETAVAMKQLKKNADGTYKTLSGKVFTKNQFTTQMSEGWFTSDVLISVLGKYSAAVNDIMKIQDENDYDNIEDALSDYEKLIEQKKKSLELDKAAGKEVEKLKEEIDQMEWAYKQFLSAQEARTLGDAINATKDAVISGWRKTFEYIIGGAKEATETWTQVSVDLFDIFNSGARDRNKILNIWGGKQLVKSGGQEVAQTLLSGFAKEIGDNGALSNSQWKDFLTHMRGNVTDELKQQMIESAYAMGALYQDADKVYHAVDGTVVSLETFDETLNSGWVTAKLLEKTIDDIKNQSLGGREDIFGTKTYIDKLDEFGNKILDENGNPIPQYVAESSGALWNFMETIKAFKNTITSAWKEVFGETTAQSLKNLTERIQKFSAKLVPVEGYFTNLKNIFKGVFSIGKMVVKIFKGLYIGIKPLLNIFSSGGKGLLKTVGDLGETFSNWVDNTEIFENIGYKIAHVTQIIATVLSKIFGTVKSWVKTIAPVANKVLKVIYDIFVKLVNLFGKAIDYIYNWAKDLVLAIKNSIVFQKAMKALQTVLYKVYEILKKVYEAFKKFIKEVMASGLAKAIKKACDVIGNAVSKMFDKINNVKADDTGDTGALSFLERLKEKLKVLEPLVVGLKNLWIGLKNLFGPLIKLIGAGLTALGDFFTGLGERIEGFLQGKNGLISFSELIKTVFKVGIAAIITKWVTAIIGAITKLIDGFSMFLTGFKGHSILERTTKAMMQFAEAMLMFTAAIIILSKLDQAGVSKAMATITAVLAMYVAFLMTIKKFFTNTERITDGMSLFKKGNGLFSNKGSYTVGPAETIKAISVLLISMSSSVLILAVAVKILASIDQDKITDAITVLISIMGIMSIFLQQLKAFITDKNAKMATPGLMTFIGIAIVMKSMAKTMLKLTEIPEENIIRGTVALMAITTALIMVIKAIAKLSSTMTSTKDKVGKEKITSKNGSISMIISTMISLIALYSKMSKVFSEIGKLSWSEFTRGILGFTLMSAGLFAVLYVLKGFDKENLKSSKKIIGILAALIVIFSILTLMVYTIAKLPPNEFDQAVSALTIIVGLLGVIALTMKFLSLFEKSKDIATTENTYVKLKGIFLPMMGFVTILVALVASLAWAVDRIMKTVGTDATKLTFMVIIIATLTASIVSILLSVLLLAKYLPDLTSKKEAIKAITKIMKSVTILIIGIALALSLMTFTISKSENGSSSALIAFLSMITILVIVIASITLLASIQQPDETKVKRITKIAGCVEGLMYSIAFLIIALTIASRYGGNNMKQAAVSLVGGMIVIFASLIFMLKIAQKMDPDKLKSLTTVFLSLALIIATFAVTLALLSSIKGDISQGFVSMSILLLVIVAFIAAAALLGPLVPVMKAFGMALLFLGGAIFLIAAGFALFVNAIEQLNNIELDGAKIAKNVEAIVVGLQENATKLGGVIGGIIAGILIGLMDQIMSFVERLFTYFKEIGFELAYLLAEMIGGIIQGLRDTGALSALVDILLDMIVVFIDRIPEIVTHMLDALVKLIDALIERIPEIAAKLALLWVTVVVNFLNAFAKALNDNADKLKDAIANLCQAAITVFKKVFHINSPSTLFQQFGTYIWQGLVNGLSGMWNGVKKVFDDLCRNVTGWFEQNIIEPFTNFGKNIIDGLLGGIKSAWSGLTSWCEKNFGWIGNTFAKIFNIHSPSRVFEQYGEYMVEGLQIGLEETAGVAKAVDNLGNTVTDEIEKSDLNDVIANMLMGLNSDIGDDIVIRPVMDLSNIQNGASQIDSMMSSLNGYRISGVGTIASDINSSMNSSGRSGSVNTTNNNSTTNNDNVYNTFNITGTNAKEIADEVAKELQKQVNRRNKTWA